MKPTFDYTASLISQYAAAPIVSTLIDAMEAWIDPRGNIDAWYNDVWNILTASGQGLDVWGRILQFGRVVNIPGTAVFFGFAEAQPSANENTWNFAPFFGGANATENYSLPDNLYRLALLAKAATNIWNGSIPGINAILLALFPYRGPTYVTDGQNMTLQYVFEFALSPAEYAIVSTPGLLPRPTGVAATIVVP
jgi:Protein of unknown function (DUF2612)